ncbi:hypothetical protein FQN54_006689 [Arachnomyces sp. PD_36]|nr:hypothetical protein FQN54_006689 [Arachnomyces sp. PD_36]
MYALGILVLAFVGASASPGRDNVKRGFDIRADALLNARSDTPTDGATTDPEETQPPTTTTTTVEEQTLAPERPIPTCVAEEGCSTETSSFAQELPPTSCSGTSTYVGSEPPTVYSTVTETYTVSGGNGIQMDDQPLITPPPPCDSTVLPGWSLPLDAFTSTVLVTKKTAVPYSEPTDPPSFTDPSDSDPETTAPPGSGDDGDDDSSCEDVPGLLCNVLPTEGSSDDSDGGCSNPDGDCDSNSDEPNPSSEDTPSESATGSPSSPDSPNPSNPDEISNNTDPKTVDGDDSISAYTISGVPVVVSPSTIQIGANLITDFLDSPTPTTLVANGQTFTIDGSEVIGPSVTIAIPTDSDSEPALSTITAADLTFLIGPSEAVISGTTYTIGEGSEPTTTVIDGTTVTIGPDGVGFPSTTIAPPTAPTTTSTGGAVAAAGSPPSNLLASIAALLPFLGAWGFL